MKKEKNNFRLKEKISKRGKIATFYRPQWSCGKVMFLHLSVSHSVHREVSASGPRGMPPGQTPPPCPVHAGIWSTSGRYASYWNTYLLKYENLYCCFKDKQFFCPLSHPKLNHPDMSEWLFCCYQGAKIDTSLRTRKLTWLYFFKLNAKCLRK